jgi:hypothetical protein
VKPRPETHPQKPALPVAPEPHTAATAPPPHAPTYTNLDKFGNLIGSDQGLAKLGQFKGHRLLFWSPHTAAGDVFFGRNNPMWKAMEDAGFTVRREFGKFKQAWLKETDQLWILSTATEAFLTQQLADIMERPEDYLYQLKMLTPAEIDKYLKERGKPLPPGWSYQDFIDCRVADNGLTLSPCFHLTAKDYDAIVAFVKSGKGLCLLADNDPFTAEADVLAHRLFGVHVSGDYLGEKIAYVKSPLVTPDMIRKFKGDYEVAEHPLLAGVYFVYEGSTISNVPDSKVPEADNLDVALRASDGKPVVAVSKVPGLNVVIDCGYTRYCHGTNERTSYILKVPGSVRLAQNIASYLASKVDAKKP